VILILSVVLHCNQFFSFTLPCLKVQMGYSRKNPHLPNGWHAGNSRGRGVDGSGNPGGRGGSRLKTLLRGPLKM